jgi:Fe2+ or Zn2+ uptake regulation protein
MNESITRQLHAQGLRMTPQRLAILDVLQRSHGHLTPLEICRLAEQALPGLTEPTVYRTLNFLAQQGLVLVAHVGNGQLVYEIAGRNHHHLICRNCGSTCEIDHDLLKSLYEQFQASTGYHIDNFHVTFFGLCPDCRASQNQST